MKPGKLQVGTSGWSYAHWAKGRFYPKGLKQTDWLSHFAQHFATVELNCSFYRLPKVDMVARWRAIAGPRFHFAVKLWRRITHEKRLVNCTRELKDFFAVVNAFGPKRGPLLVQLPPSMHKDVGRLQVFLADLRTAPGRLRWKTTIEFRHTDWLSRDVEALLNQQGVARCLADLSHCPITEPNEVDFVYVRRHGPGGPYRGCYSAEHIAEDARRIQTWLHAGRDVYVYYNNDTEGYAIDNARQLIEAVTHS